MTSFLSFVLRSSMRSRRRSVLTISGIAAAFCLLGVLSAMYTLFFRTEPSPDQALRLIVRNRISFANPIPVSYAARIRELPGVKEVMIQQWFGGTYKDSREAAHDFARFAVEPEKLFILHPEYAISRAELLQFMERQDACILGRQLAQRLGLKLGDHIFVRGDIFPVLLNLVVSGFYDSVADNDALYFNNRYLKELLRHNPDFSIMLTVLVDSPSSVSGVARGIDDLFRNSMTQTRTETEKSYRVRFLKYLGNVKLFLFGVAASLAGMMLLATTNSVAMSIRERTPEIGILKALGFTPAAVIGLVAGESILLALCGAVIGLCGSQALIVLIRRIPVAMVNLPTLALSPVWIAGGAVLAVACALTATLPIALRAAHYPIVEAIRQAD